MSEAIVRDPKPSIERIESLAKRIVESDILLPKFQRDFVWNRPQILDLFDSIAKNYPIGSILLWLSKNKLKSETNIADLPFKERPDEYPVNYLLDGQQRLSCICGALFWKPEEGNGDSVWNIAYDLRSQRFVHLSTTDDPPISQIRLNKLQQPSAFFAHVAALDSSEETKPLVEEAKAIFDRFKDYSIACVTLHDMEIESVAPIFERINSTGTKLTIVDLMRAATWSEGFDLVDSIDDKVLAAISPKNFDEIDRKAVLRVLSGASGFSFSTSGMDRLRDRSVEQLKAATDETVEAFKLAVDFLHDQLNIPNARIVPYVNQIVVLADIFRRLPNPNAQQQAALKQWFWRTTLSSYFSGWSSAQMDSDKKAIDAFVSGDSEVLEIGDGIPSKGIWKTRTFRGNTSLSKLLGLLLAQNDPRDLITGQKVSLKEALAWQNSKEYHHIFPKAYLKGDFPSSDINCLANFALLSSSSNKIISDKKPSQYFAECASSLGDQFGHVMSTNFISDAALAHAFDDDFESFKEERADSIHKYARELCGLPPEGEG